MNEFDSDEDNNDGNGDKKNIDDELGGGGHT